MVPVDRSAWLQFLNTAYEPDDWIAVFLKAYDTGRVTQRIGPLAMFREARWQTWLAAMHDHRFNMYVAVNALVPHSRRRTRESIGAIRHVFTEADREGPRVLATVHARRDLPPPSYVLHSSPNRLHVLWRVKGFSPAHVERLQKQLARELGTDPAATPSTQTTRLPGFWYLKSPVAVTRWIRRCCKNLTMRRCRAVREWKRPVPLFSSDASWFLSTARIAQREPLGARRGT
jgi:hypothetical protein